MLYWFTFFVVVLVVALISNLTSTSIKEQRIFRCLLIFILIYFSTFRAGLGTDYIGYVERISRISNLNQISIANEPVFSLLAFIVNVTSLSPVFLFAIFSSITLISVFSFYNSKDNDFWLSSVLIFALLPILYFNTFNLVRQFAATGIFMLSLRYIREKNIRKYCCCILFASLIHFSAVILLPCYFLLNAKISPSYWIIIFLIVILSVSQMETLINSISIFSDKYGLYADSDEKMGASGIIFLYNVLCVILMLNHSRINNSFDIVAINCFYLFTIISDISYLNFYFYRFSIYFSPVLAYILPRCLSFYFSKKITNIISISFAIYLFITFISANVTNSLIVPENILPVSTLFRDHLFNSYIF